jgi:hypothetical protein
VVIDNDGTVHVPAQDVPMSSCLSPEAKACVTQHLKDMQNPRMLAQDNGVPRGGRQALLSAQRFPLAFDGVMSVAPADTEGRSILSKAFRMRI